MREEMRQGGGGRCPAYLSSDRRRGASHRRNAFASEREQQFGEPTVPLPPHSSSPSSTSPLPPPARLLGEPRVDAQPEFLRRPLRNSVSIRRCELVDRERQRVADPKRVEAVGGWSTESAPSTCASSARRRSTSATSAYSDFTDSCGSATAASVYVGVRLTAFAFHLPASSAAAVGVRSHVASREQVTDGGTRPTDFVPAAATVLPPAWCRMMPTLPLSPPMQQQHQQSFTPRCRRIRFAPGHDDGWAAPASVGAAHCAGASEFAVDGCCGATEVRAAATAATAADRRWSSRSGGVDLRRERSAPPAPSATNLDEGLGLQTSAEHLQPSASSLSLTDRRRSTRTRLLRASTAPSNFTATASNSSSSNSSQSKRGSVAHSQQPPTAPVPPRASSTIGSQRLLRPQRFQLDHRSKRGYRLRNWKGRLGSPFRLCWEERVGKGRLRGVWRRLLTRYRLRYRRYLLPSSLPPHGLNHLHIPEQSSTPGL
ncbi:hypothetical protein M407DRAFT_34243 [Tulasnella calospora MUT 4182]|uniref:Uncharacterized protein n=1 Tax=Tulasnella calospora MUT 4182 TaxID=1051891 RepID=A0A0C3PNV2_9AGAM|nr:hypothetical protein M407DRAFT_34243 [Tulasnella calospora MUT 4182]